MRQELSGAAFLLAFCTFGLLLAVAFGAWAYYKDKPIGHPPVVEVVSEEGVAKATMIKELTGIEFPPEVARWANVNFTGTDVSIDTESFNVWLGKNWKEKTK